jgi:carbonic anhydrase/acetyltransferase-like protein (isoleucine patch superfamily)
MQMNRSRHRRRPSFRPQAELAEDRLLLSTVPNVTTFQLSTDPPATQAVRPNRPVSPYGNANKNASFIDPTVSIKNGNHVLLGNQNYVGPFARLDATSGFIKIGNGSFIGDNSSIVSDPGIRARNPTTTILIGDNVLVGYGATVEGPSQIGAYGALAKATEVGTRAVVNGAIIGPGAIVGAMAYVGPGVTVPGGVEVLPGASVTTDAEASDPALGKVIPVPSADLISLGQQLANNRALANGYSALYQGQSATGVSPGTNSGVFNGNLAAVEGANNQPGTSNLNLPTRAVTVAPGFTVAATPTSFEPATPTAPTFIAPRGQKASSILVNFRGRVVGGVNFSSSPKVVMSHLGRGVSIDGDQGQPINFGFISRIGNNVTIAAPIGGTLTIGRFFSVGSNSVVLGGGGSNHTIGDQVSIGSGTAVVQSSLGNNVTIGNGAYVANSTLAAGTVVPDGEILIDNKVVSR